MEFDIETRLGSFT